MSQKNHIPTLFFIGAIVWAITNTGHEIIGHGGIAALLGYKALGVSTSFFIYDESVVSFWEGKAITAGGIFFNLCLAYISYSILKKGMLKSIHTTYFFWLLMSLNLFYSGSYIMGWFFGPTLDSASFIVGFESPTLLKAVLILLGILVVLIGFQISSATLEYLIDSVDKNEGRKISILTFYPYLAAITIKVLAGLMNQGSDKMLVILGSFGASGIFLVWVNFVRFWPYRKVSSAQWKSVV